jgi:hypothetical protein
MFRFGALILAPVVVAFVSIGGCGGGNDNTGGGGEPAYIVGTWAGPMTHRIIDNNKGTDDTISYTVTFYILSQDGSSVSGKMRLQDDSHVGLLRGSMSGNTFRGVRTGTHTVQIEFTVNGSSLSGTFRFVGDGLDEYGDYTCSKQ